MISKFKTYGGLLDVLQPFLSAAYKDAHVKYFGTRRFFVMQAELVHLAFDKFCELNGVSPEDAPRLLKDVIGFVELYPHHQSHSMRVLRTTLPDVVNVRGKWTSPRM